MEERQGKNGSYEDWGAVMQMLLHGDPEHKQIAFLKLNRLISSFLVSQAWDYHDHWEDLQQTVLMKLVKSFCQGQLRKAQAFAVHLNITTDQTRILVTAVREGEHIALTLTFRDTGQRALAGQRVFLRRQGRSVFSTKTDSNGELRSPRLKPDSYEVACPGLKTIFQLEFCS